MRITPNPTRKRRLVLVSGVLLMASAALADDDVSDLLNTGKPATAPAPVTSPDAPENQPIPTTAPTARPPRDSRSATLTLNNGTILKGPLWTTTATPFRIWIEKDHVYKDVELEVIKSIDVHVISEAMEDDWRWLKEGSDQKIYSGKKYPNVVLEYRFTLLNDTTIEGSVLAPIYFADSAANKTRTFALYKKYKGALDQTLADLVYVKSIALDPPAPSDAADVSTRTSKLPLLPD